MKLILTTAEYNHLIYLSQFFVLFMLKLNKSECNVTAADMDTKIVGEALEEFRELVKESSLAYRDFMKSDGYLIRWLQANNFDVEAALEKFRKCVEWRKANNIDLILLEDFSIIDETYQFAVEGFDKGGRPIVWLPFGSYDIRKIAMSGVQDKYQRYVIRLLEMGELYSYEIRKAGNQNITQFIAIYDLAGFNLKLGGCIKCLGMIPELVTNYDSYYPEIFYKGYVINTPTLFNSAFNIARNFMAQRTRESLQIFDYDKLKWEAALHQQISLDQLPIEYGGNKPSFYSNLVRNRHKQLISNMIEISAKQIETELHHPLQNEVEQKHDMIANISHDNKTRVNNAQSNETRSNFDKNINIPYKDMFEKILSSYDSPRPNAHHKIDDNNHRVNDPKLNHNHRHHHHVKDNNISLHDSQTSNHSIISTKEPDLLENEKIPLSFRKEFHRNHTHNSYAKSIRTLSSMNSVNLMMCYYLLIVLKLFFT